MNEKQIESKLTDGGQKAGGIAPEARVPRFRRDARRLILLPDGHVGFAELKAPGEKPRPLQLTPQAPSEAGIQGLRHRRRFRRLEDAR